MTALQWVELVIFIILFRYTAREPKESRMGLPDSVETFYSQLSSIPLTIFCCVYNIWYAFNQVPFFWYAGDNLKNDSVLSFLFYLFYFACILVVPILAILCVVFLYLHLNTAWEHFKNCYKATRGILKNNHFSCALLQIKQNNASVKYISFRTFLKVKDVISIYIEPEYYTLFYRTHNRKKIFFSCSPITYFVILLSVIKQRKEELKEQEEQDSKERKKKVACDDSELLEIFIEDLQKRKEENEKKANQYFNQAKETFEQVKNNS